MRLPGKWGDEHGVVEVTRLIPNALAACKGVAFSVDTGDEAKDAGGGTKDASGRTADGGTKETSDGTKLSRHWYTTFACLDGKQWKWALAEPATERWDALQ
jgi:hypothetical protein